MWKREGIGWVLCGIFLSAVGRLERIRWFEALDCSDQFIRWSIGRSVGSSVPALDPAPALDQRSVNSH